MLVSHSERLVAWWKPPTNQQMEWTMEKEWKVDSHLRSGMAIHPTGYLAMGDDEGVISIYDTRSGSLVHEIEQRQSRYPITACAFSQLAEDPFSLFHVGDSPHLFRWQPIDQGELKRSQGLSSS